RAGTPSTPGPRTRGRLSRSAGRGGARSEGDGPHLVEASLHRDGLLDGLGDLPEFLDLVQLQGPLRPAGQPVVEHLIAADPVFPDLRIDSVEALFLVVDHDPALGGTVLAAGQLAEFF